MARLQTRVASVQCTVASVHCTVYSVQCTVYSVQCTVYTVQHSPSTDHCREVEGSAMKKSSESPNAVIVEYYITCSAL